MKFNRELSELTDVELTQMLGACDRALGDGMLAARIAVRMYMNLTEEIRKGQRRRHGGRDLSKRIAARLPKKR